MEWWETLNCKGMLLAVGSEEMPAGEGEEKGPDQMMYCAHYDMTAPTNMAGTIEVGGDVDMKIKMYFDMRYMVTDAMTMSASFMDLRPGATYMYRVRAANAVGAGMWSESDSATTTENMMPMAGDAIGDQTVTEGAMDSTMDLSMYFSDGDDAMLTYTAESSNDAVADVSVDGSTLTIDYGEVGMATITVKATDMFDDYAMQTFDVEVVSASTELTAPSNVMVTPGGTGELSFTWEGGDNADLVLLLAVDLNTVGTDDVMYDRATGDAEMRTGEVSGLTSGTQYLGIVVVIKGSGDAAEYLYSAGDSVAAP